MPAAVPRSMDQTLLEISGVFINWGSNLPDKPAIGVQGQLYWPGRVGPYGFELSYRKTSGVGISGKGGRLPRAVEAALLGALGPGLARTWVAAQKLADSTFERRVLPGTQMRLEHILVRGETSYTDPPGAPARFSLSVWLKSRTHGALTWNIYADGRVDFAHILPPASHRAMFPDLTRTGYLDAATAAGIIGQWLGGPAQGRDITAASIKQSPAVLDFARTVMAALKLPR